MDDQLWQPGVEAEFDFHLEWGLPPDSPPFNDGLEFMSAFNFKTPNADWRGAGPSVQTKDTEGGVHQEPVNSASTGDDSNFMEIRARRYLAHFL